MALLTLSALPAIHYEMKNKQILTENGTNRCLKANLIYIYIFAYTNGLGGVKSREYFAHAYK